MTTNGLDGAHVPPDASDIAELWISAGQGDPLTTATHLAVPIGRPREFFRTVPDPSYRQLAEMVIRKSENMIGEAHYVVATAMRGKMEEARPCLLVCVVDRLGSPRLWPLKQPRDGERDNVAWETSRAIARTGLERWVRAVWVSSGVGFKERLAEVGYAPDPDFGKLPEFDALVDRAFGKNGIIRDENHPVYRELFGIVAPAAREPDDPLL
jgi:hypothetical protein